MQKKIVKIKLEDGRILAGSGRDIIEAMREESRFFAGVNVEKYLEELQARVHRFQGQEILLDKRMSVDRQCLVMLKALVRAKLAKFVSFRLFIYGALKRRGYEEARIYGVMYDYCGWYPCVVEIGKVKEVVKGQVRDVDDETLRLLDRREGVAAGQYRRILTRTLEGEYVWAYEWARPISRKRHRRIPAGVWDGRIH